MILAEQQGVHLIFPWQDRKREFSWLKATTLALMFVPALWIVYQIATEQFGPVPLGGMTYWSGLSATALLLLALAVTPVMTIFRLGRLIDVRRMIGVTALAYVESLGPLPADIQEITAISAGLNKAAGAPDAASALMKFLASPAAAPAKRKTGLEPG
jgi:hypothetical protein